MGVRPVEARRWRAWGIAGALLLAAAVGVVAVVTFLRPDMSGTPSRGAADTIVVSRVVDRGGSLDVAWDGPANIDYGVEITPGGGAGTTRLVGRARNTTVTVTAGVPYCVRVRGTDGSRIVESAPVPVRGAECD